MKNNEIKKSNPLRFDEGSLESKGFIRDGKGTWHKPANPVGRVAGGKHSEQTGALEQKAPAKCSRKIGSKKGSRRKRPAEIIVTMTAHLPRYFDDDNLAGALKPVRDELADWIGVDDGDRRILWEHDQTLTRGNPGVCVKIQYAN